MIKFLSPLSKAKQSGFAAIASLFVLVTLASLGAFMLTFSTTQHLNSVRDAQGSRAYWAARAGLEFGVTTVTSTSTCPASPTLLAVDGFSVCLSCVQANYTENSATPNVAIFKMESVARSPAVASCASLGAVGTGTYIERSVSLSMER